MHPIAKYCRRHKLTQAEFAERVGLSQQMVSNVVNGHRLLSWASARRIVQFTGGEITLADLSGIRAGKARAA